jgi:hypothetical protein
VGALFEHREDRAQRRPQHGPDRVRDDLAALLAIGLAEVEGGIGREGDRQRARVGIARPVAVDEDEGTVTIAFPPGSAFNRRKADDKDNRELVAAAILTVLGTPLRPVYTMLEEAPEPEASGPAGGDEVEAATGENELVERFIAEFDAEVVIDDEPDKPIEETS